MFTFDNATGAYEIVLTADAANPFVPAGPLFNLAVGIEIFNADTGSTAQDPSFFRRGSSLTLDTPTTTVKLAGTDPRLLAWEAGDRVAPSIGVLGNPDGIRQFESRASVVGDIIFLGKDSLAPGEFTTIQPIAVPEPSVLTLLGVATIGLLGYGVGRWRWVRATEVHYQAIPHR